MKIINAGYEILTPTEEIQQAVQRIARIARVCYKSEQNASADNDIRLVKNLISSGHEAMLEHFSFSVLFTVDRGISHEIVRHRMASFAQESTRYCNYSKDKFGNEITVIKPCDFMFTTDSYIKWVQSCEAAESAYIYLINNGEPAQDARAVLPNSLKTEIVMTANIREWRHFFKLRASGTTGKPHPQMLEVTVPLLQELKEITPLFDDIEVK